MINTIVWCMLTITLNGEVVETAVKGKVKAYQNPDILFVDFSEYAKKQQYEGNWTELKEVNKDICIEDK
jgi:hypothetical protein